MEGRNICFQLQSTRQRCVFCSGLLFISCSAQWIQHCRQNQAFCSSCDQGRPDQHQLSPASHSGCCWPSASQSVRRGSPRRAKPHSAASIGLWGQPAGEARPPFSLAPWGICVMNFAGIKIPPWSPDLSLQTKFATAELSYLMHLVRLGDVKM